MLAKIAPEECLLYFASAGMARPDPTSTNQTEKLCAEPEVQRAVAQVEKMIRTAVKESVKKSSPKEQALAEAVPTMVKALLTRPLAVYAADVTFAPRRPPQFRGGAVLSLGEGEEIKAAFDRLLAMVPPDSKASVTISGTAFERLLIPDGPELVLGAQGKYYYIAAGEGEMEALLKRAEGTAPKWLTELHKQLPVDRVSTVTMLNAHGVLERTVPLGPPEAARVLDALGVKELDRVRSVSGLDKDGMITRSLVSFKGEPKGLLQLFEQRPLTPADLDVVPRDASFAVALKLDPSKAWSTILDIVEKIDPKEKEKLLAHMGEEGKDLLGEALKALGDSWCVFDSPSEGGLFTGTTAVVSIKDADAAAALQKKLIGMMESGSAHVEKFTFHGHAVHVLVPPERKFPLAPSWCLTDKHLILAPFPGAIKGMLSRGTNFQGLSKVPDIAKALEGVGQTMSISYLNMQRFFDLIYPMAPVFFQMMASEMRAEGIDVPPDLLPSAGSIRRHLRPSVSTLRRVPGGVELVSHQVLPGGQGLAALPALWLWTARRAERIRVGAADRTESANNLKQMTLAMVNLADSNRGVMPAAAIYSKEGKPLLSWRVAILPYIEENALYKEFHLDEPWDSEHNKKLLARMPRIYRRPGAAAGEKTHYRVFHGPGAAFEGKEGLRYPASFPDGTSNTILIVEAEEAVPWTRPDELPFDAKNDKKVLPPLGLPGNDYFLVSLADGSVRSVGKKVSQATLRAAITANGGEVLGPDW
jgi:hypothetical protein